MSSAHLPLTLRRLLGPGDPEISCESCFNQLDVYVDTELTERDAAEAVPAMAAHLRGCPACAAEYDSLKALLER